MKNDRTSFVLSLLYCALLFFFIITFSIALPIYFRPFYYAHINALDLRETSGFTETEIKEAYNDVLDYLTLPDKEFSSGVMEYSEEGKAHFTDCKKLFDLNAAVLIISSVCLIVLLFLKNTGKVKPFMLGRRSAEFYSAIAAVGIPIIIGAIASVNFDKAFTVFHKIFFPGKTNWLFNPYTDKIILVLPQQFFMNCAILIGVSILTFSIILIATEKKRSKRRNNYGLEKIL